MEMQSLHEFMLHTKSVIYIIILLVLLAMPALWYFLNGADKE